MGEFLFLKEGFEPFSAILVPGTSLRKEYMVPNHLNSNHFGCNQFDVADISWQPPRTVLGSTLMYRSPAFFFFYFFNFPKPLVEEGKRCTQ
jgi:hypothetical protein